MAKTHRANPIGLKYYKVIGKNKYIPKTYYTKATDVAIAKQHFYLEAGTDITSVVKITKKTYEENISKCVTPV